MRARRALLYMPGDDLHKIQKATTLGVDCICMDIEDGVALNQKAFARETIAHALQTLEFNKSERLVRINPVGSGLETDDLLSVLPSKPDGIVIPKVTNGYQINWADEQISASEKQFDWLIGNIVILALIETAHGIVNLREIATSSTRLEALIFGAEDLAVDVGAQRSKSGWEVFYARSAVVTYAAAYGLQAIDMVNIDLKDLEGLRTQATQGMRLGYEGKQIIHPNHIEPVQKIFTPDQESITRAESIIEAYAIHQEKGQGAFAMDGKMVDAPVMKSAQRTIERARAAGKI
jgi:citrate lyase beta subunit